VKANKFLEYAVVHGHSYGTLMSDVESVWADNSGAFLVVDIQGKETIKARFPEAPTIFLLPPSSTEMERRLRGRKTDSEETIQIRLHQALAEIKKAPTYDYILVNGQIESTVYEIQVLVKTLFMSCRQHKFLNLG